MAVPHVFAVGATLIILKAGITYILAAKNKDQLIKGIDKLSEMILDSPLETPTKRKAIELLSGLKHKLPDDDFDFQAMKKEIAEEMKDLSDTFDEAVKKGTKTFLSVFEKFLKDDTSDDK